jgi:1-deoxy-D-xylulose-5-phosphate reductoisomerase
MPSMPASAAQTWRFEPLDDATFPSVALARRAGAAGGLAPAVYNAANEVLVDAFHAEQVGFLQIVDVVADVVDEWLRTHPDGGGNLRTVEDVEQADAWARARAQALATD